MKLSLILLLTIQIALSLLFFMISLESFIVLGLCWTPLEVVSSPSMCLKLLISPLGPLPTSASPALCLREMDHHITSLDK